MNGLSIALVAGKKVLEKTQNTPDFFLGKEALLAKIDNLESYISELETENRQLKVAVSDLGDNLVNSVTTFYTGIHTKCSEMLGTVMKEFPSLNWTSPLERDGGANDEKH